MPPLAESLYFWSVADTFQPSEVQKMKWLSSADVPLFSFTLINFNELTIAVNGHLVFDARCRRSTFLFLHVLFTIGLHLFLILFVLELKNLQTH